MVGMRMTTPRLLVLQALMTDPAQERYGLELAGLAGLEAGTIYPILVAFENAGWLTSRSEEIDVHAEGRPRRRYYQLTPDGIAAATAALVKTAGRRTTAPRKGLAW